MHHCPLFTKFSAFNAEDLLLFSFEKHCNRIAILADFFTKPINLQRNLKNLNEMTFLSGWYTKLRMCMRAPNLRECQVSYDYRSYERNLSNWEWENV